MPIASVNDSSADPSSERFPIREDASTTGSQGAQSAASGRISRGRIWTGRVLTALTTLLLLVDAVGKLVMPPQVVEACTRLRFPLHLVPGIGILLLVCTALYVLPRTAVLGAILTTGFLGGAVAIQIRAGSPLFETIFPVIFAVVMWAGIYLRECRLCGLLPFRT